MALTPTGLTIKSLAEIKDEVRVAVRASIGARVQLGPESIIGQLIDIYAERESLLWELSQALYDAFDPDQASGAALDNLVALNGLTRQPATPSVGVLSITTSGAATVPVGSVYRVPDGPRFVTTAALSAPGAGTYPVAIESEDAGAIEAVAGAITELVTVILNVASVTNAADVTPGTDLETDEELRARRESSLQVTGVATDQAIRSNVLAIETVQQAVVISNRTAVVDAFGTAPHAFKVILYPIQSDNAPVWQTIYDAMPAAVRADGPIRGDATTTTGQTVEVGFELALETPIHVLVEIGGSLPPTVVADVKALVAAQTFEIGGSVRPYSLSCLIEDAFDGVNDLKVFVRALVAPTPDILYLEPVSVAINQIPIIDAADVDVTVL